VDGTTITADVGELSVSQQEMPQGEGISIEDVRILIQALGVSIEFEEYGNGTDMTSEIPDAEQSELTYGQYRSIYEQIGGSDMDIPEFAEKYEDSYIFMKEDWYEAYKFMLAYLDTDSSIWKTTVFIIKVDEQNRKLYTQNGEYEYLSSSFKDAAFSKEEVYVKGEQLLTCTRVLPEETILENVWVMEINGGSHDVDSGNGILMECFYHQIAFTVPSDSEVAGAAVRESITDLTFENGRLIRQQQKTDKIRGKLLSVSDSTIEIEGYGTYETEDNLEIYKLCGTLEAQKKTDLMIGYDYTDFVVWNDKICAALVSREGETDQIRVLLKNTGNGSYYYDEAVVTVDGQQTRIKADEMKKIESAF
ncbi:MAG: hypothetical protein K2H31_10305, partial [Lachnospiraceae bacterium]|nr:hypothetical protein [Lachnospiraceae bacterium]